MKNLIKSIPISWPIKAVELRKDGVIHFELHAAKRRIRERALREFNKNLKKLTGRRFLA